MDNLKTLGLITTEVLGVSFKPETGADEADANGELTLGGVDTTKYTGTLTYFPRLATGTASYYWGITVASFTYGTTSLATAATAIVDTGTTLIYIPTAAYTKFLTASGGKTDASSGLAIFTVKPTANFGITFVSFPGLSTPIIANINAGFNTLHPYPSPIPGSYCRVCCLWPHYRQVLCLDQRWWSFRCQHYNRPEVFGVLLLSLRHYKLSYWICYCSLSLDEWTSMYIAWIKADVAIRSWKVKGGTGCAKFSQCQCLHDPRLAKV